MGTVKGDLHDIGKNLCIMMLRGAGFEVVDLGVDTSADDFIDAVEEHQPGVLGMSALLTTTMPNMGQTIEAFIDADLRDDVKIMVGGAPVTQEFADEMGADGYGKDAMACVALARDLVEAGSQCLSAIDPEAYRQRLDRISEIFSSMQDDGRRPVDAALPVQEPPRPLHGAVRLPQPAQAAGQGRAADLRRRRQDRLPQCLGDRPEPLRRGRALAVTRTLFDDAQATRRCGCRPRAGPAGAAASASSRCATAPSTCAPPTDASRSSCASRSGSPARPSSPTPRRDRRLRGPAPPAAHRRRRSREPRSEPIDPVVRVVDGIVHYGEAPLEPRAQRRLRHRASTSARRPSCSSSSTSLDGRTVEVVALENPQRFGGSDVINRISYDEADESGALRQALRRRSTASCRTSTSAAASTGARSTRSSSSATRRCATSSSASTSRRSASGPYKSVTELELLDGRRDDHGADRARPRARRARAPAGPRLGRAADREPRRRGRRRRPRRHRPRRHAGRRAHAVDVGTNTEVVLAGRGRILPRAARPGPPSRAAR